MGGRLNGSRKRQTSQCGVLQGEIGLAVRRREEWGEAHERHLSTEVQSRRVHTPIQPAFKSRQAPAAHCSDTRRAGGGVRGAGGAGALGRAPLQSGVVERKSRPRKLTAAQANRQLVCACNEPRCNPCSARLRQQTFRLKKKHVICCLRSRGVPYRAYSFCSAHTGAPSLHRRPIRPHLTRPVRVALCIAFHRGISLGGGLPSGAGVRWSVPACTTYDRDWALSVSCASCLKQLEGGKVKPWRQSSCYTCVSSHHSCTTRLNTMLCALQRGYQEHFRSSHNPNRLPTLTRV